MPDLAPELYASMGFLGDDPRPVEAHVSERQWVHLRIGQLSVVVGGNTAAELADKITAALQDPRA